MDNKSRQKSMVGHVKTVGFSTALSRVLGMVRDILYAAYLGARELSDAFFIALIIPNLFRNLFGEGALSTAYVPIAQDEAVKKGEGAMRRFFGFTLFTLFIILTTITIICISVFTIILSFYDDATLSLLRITFPYMIFICMAAICQATLNIKEHFLVPALSPVLFNALIIAGLFAGNHYFPDNELIIFLSILVPVIGLIQLLVHLIPLIRKKVLPRFTMSYDSKVVGEFLRIFFPTLLALAVVQVNELMDTIIAKLVIPHDGAVSHIYYANRLIQLPYALFGVSVAVVAFPRLARFFSQNETGQFKKSAREAITIMLFWTIPASAGLLACSREIIELLFFRGEFGMRSLFITSSIVQIYSVGLPLICLNYLLIRTLYSIKDMKTPFVVSICSACVNFVLNAILAYYFYEDGIAYATVATAVFNCALYVLALLRKGVIDKDVIPSGAIIKIVVFSLISALLALNIVGHLNIFIVVSLTFIVYMLLSFLFNREAFRISVSRKSGTHT